MLTLASPLVCFEKPEIDNFFSSVSAIVLPVITVKNTEELVLRILKATPSYIALRENFIDTFDENVATLQGKASEVYQFSIDNLEIIPEKQEKIREAFHWFISASQKLLKTIEQTSSKRLSSFIKSASGNTLWGKMVYTEFLFQCCRECLTVSSTAINPGVLKWIINAFYTSAKELQEFVDSILEEWDVLTDLVGMEAVKKSHEARKLTGKPVKGSKTIQDFLHELES